MGRMLQDMAAHLSESLRRKQSFVRSAEAVLQSIAGNPEQSLASS